MKRTALIILLMVLGFSQAVNAQEIIVVEMEATDTALIYLSEFVGDLSWEYSMDGTTWDSLPWPSDTIFSLVGVDMYLRGKVVAGYCPPYYTEHLFLDVNVILPPTLTTTEVTEITETGAVSGGNVSNDGGDAVTVRGVCWSTSYPPTIDGNKTEDGSGTGSFVSTMTDLYPGTEYWVAAYATNSLETMYGEVLSFTTPGDAPLIDIDGNVYGMVQIGDQVWMTENLRVTRYPDGTPIPLVENADQWDTITASDRAYCWYVNTEGNKDPYGALYTWAAAMNGAWGNGDNDNGIQGVCPDDWHLPGDAEWKTLENFLGMSYADQEASHYRGTNEGGKLKEQGIDHWQDPNIGATNETGFTALASGYRNPYGGGFFGMGEWAFFWTASEHFMGNGAWCRGLKNDYATIYRKENDPERGYSVRCVKGKLGIYPPALLSASVYDIYETFATARGSVGVDQGAEVTARGFCWSTSPNPSIDNDTTLDGKGVGYFYTSLTGLSPGTTYYARAYATNSRGTGYSTEFSFTTADPGSTVSDYDGNAYYTVQIGDQVWMAENMRSTHLDNGTNIPLVENATNWAELGGTAPAYCWYVNDSETSDPYGALYTWTAAMGVCPAGWHIPSEADWESLVTYLGGEEVAGGKLKETSSYPNDFWSFPNTGATNESGFSAVGGGQRTYGGTFRNFRQDGVYWTSTFYEPSSASFQVLNYKVESTSLGGSQTNSGSSVRCVKD